MTVEKHHIFICKYLKSNELFFWKALLHRVKIKYFSMKFSFKLRSELICIKMKIGKSVFSSQLEGFIRVMEAHL